MKATSIASAITSFVSRINEDSWARAACACLIAAGLGCFFVVASGRADDVALPAHTAQLQHRLAQIEAGEDSKYAEGALGQAHRALQVASSPTEAPKAVWRAQQIARAALALAERQIERHRVQAELFTTQRRLAAMRERASAQRRVLQALMKERAELARSGGAQP